MGGKRNSSYMTVIQGYPSRVRVGRGSDEIDQPSSWEGAVTPKPPVKAKKTKRDQRTDGPTDRPTGRAGCRVACTRLKTPLCLNRNTP